MPVTAMQKPPAAILSADSIHRTIERFRAEFLEMPGLRSTAEQVQRLFGVDKAVCREVLDALVASKALRKNRDGTYLRLISRLME
jgi:hypothetical protein